jgi:hypothetical protein
MFESVELQIILGLVIVLLFIMLDIRYGILRRADEKFEGAIQNIKKTKDREVAGNDLQAQLFGYNPQMKSMLSADKL